MKAKAREKAKLEKETEKLKERLKREKEKAKEKAKKEKEKAKEKVRTPHIPHTENKKRHRTADTII